MSHGKITTVVTPDVNLMATPSITKQTPFLQRWWWLLVPALILFSVTVRGLVPLWFNSESQLLFGGLVQVLTVFLIWSRRDDWNQTSHELEELFPNPRDARRSGSPVLLILGGIAILVAQVAALSQLTVISFWLLVVGTIFYVFGPFLLRVVAIPLLYALLAIPPPMGLALGIVRQFELTGSAMLGGALGLFGIKTRVSGPTVTLQDSGHIILVGGSQSGVGVFLCVLTITLAYLIWRRAPLGKSLVVMIVAGFGACVLGLVRNVLLGLIGQLSDAALTLLEDRLALVPALLTLLASLMFVYVACKKLLRASPEIEEIGV